jgi:DNA-binding Lrp family transcriptional regulator
MLMRAYVFINVQPRISRDVVGKISAIAGAKAAHPCWGLPDIVAQVEVESETALENLVIGQIQATEGVTETDTHIILGD